MHPAIDEALDFLDQLANGEASFLQIAKHSNKMLVSAAQIRMTSHMAPILGVLSQMASEEVVADSALIQQLESLFLTFKAKLEAENVAAIEAEEAAIAKYEADVARIETILENLKAQQAALEFEIAELDKCIITQQNIVASATQKIDRNQRLYDSAVKMCHAMDVQYESAKAGRKAELELLAAITIKVEEHFAKFSAGVVERGELDNFDNTYENASAYESKSFSPAL